MNAPCGSGPWSGDVVQLHSNGTVTNPFKAGDQVCAVFVGTAWAGSYNRGTNGTSGIPCETIGNGSFNALPYEALPTLPPVPNPLTGSYSGGQTPPAGPSPGEESPCAVSGACDTTAMP